MMVFFQGFEYPEFCQRDSDRNRWPLPWLHMQFHKSLTPFGPIRLGVQTKHVARKFLQHSPAKGDVHQPTG